MIFDVFLYIIAVPAWATIWVFIVIHNIVRESYVVSFSKVHL